MSGQKRLKAYIPTQLPPWLYISETSITLNGADRQAVTVPSRASIVEIRARGGEVYFSINGLASNASGGYIPEDQAEIIGPLGNQDFTLSVFSETASTVAHIMFFVES